MTLMRVLKMCEEEIKLYYKEAEILKDDAIKEHDSGFLERSIELMEESEVCFQKAMAIVDLRMKIMEEVENDG